MRLYKKFMGYPPAPEEPGADKFFTACFFLLFGLFTMLLLASCLFSAGRLLGFIIPGLVPTLIIARFVEKKAKSPTTRQIAIYYQFHMMGFGLCVPFFAAVYFFTYLR